MRHATKVFFGLAVLLVVAAAQAVEDGDKTFLLSKLLHKKHHATGPSCSTPPPILPGLVIVVEWTGADDLDLSVDAPDIDNNICFVGNDGSNDDDIFCNARYAGDKTSSPGLEIINFPDPISGEYKVIVERFTGDDTAEFTVTVFSPELGRLVLTDPEVQTLPDDDTATDISLEYPDQYSAGARGAIFTFTLP